jgi:hypothetical protein
VHYLLICAVALAASGLTFFTGFGLGTLLLPAFALFFPVEVAVGLTAVVHLPNSLFKLVLVGRHADIGLVLRFGVPAFVSALGGAWLLLWLSDLTPLYSYRLGDNLHHVTPIKLVVAVLMVAFALIEMSPRFKQLAIPPKYMPLGGIVTGFFGGISGHQGAFRSAFLLRAGLAKESFIATGVAIAVIIDLSRLAVYWGQLLVAELSGNAALLAGATGSAFLGAFLGNKLLRRITLNLIETAVSVMLLLIAVALAGGLI